MREIKFRGKVKYNGNHLFSQQWIGGSYWFDFLNDIHYIIYTEYDDLGNVLRYNEKVEVIAETVGQFTGLKDKNGADIYEGDKIGDLIVTWCGNVNEGLGLNVGFYLQRDNFESWIELEAREDYEITGNIHEVSK